MQPKELADICEAMENAIRDLHVEYETVIEPPITQKELKGTIFGAPEGAVKYDWIAARPFAEKSLSIKNESVLDGNGNISNCVNKQSSDGQICKYLQITDPNAVHPKIEGIITKRKNFVVHLPETPLDFMIVRYQEEPFNFSLSKALREKEEWVEIDDTIKKVNGFNTICLTLCMEGIKTPEGKKIPVEHIYFSVDHGYTPVKFEVMYRKGPGSSVNVTELEKVQQGLWFPKSGYRDFAGDKEDLFTNRIIRYKAAKIEINQGFTEKDFDILFPPGTKVNDEIFWGRGIPGLCRKIARPFFRALGLPKQNCCPNLPDQLPAAVVSKE